MSTPQARLSTPASAVVGNVDVLLAGTGISGIGKDGDGDGWVPACEHFALARSDLRRHQIRRSWSPARRARTEGTAGD